MEYSIQFYLNGPTLWPTLPHEMAVFGLFCELYDMLMLSMDDVSYVSFLQRAGLLDMYFNRNAYVDD